MSLPFPEGTTALATDSEQRSLQKLVELANSGGGGGGGVGEVVKLTGSNTPGAAPASGGGIAYNEAGDMWRYDAGTGWVKFLSA